MNQRVKDLLAEARQLAPAEREELAELLLATLEAEPGLGDAWAREIDDRIAAHERGELLTRPAEDVLRKYLGK